MGKLNKKYWKISRIMLIIEFIVMGVAILFLPRGTNIYNAVVILITAVLIMLSLHIQFKFLKCPNCKKGSFRPPTDPCRAKQYCPKCGHLIEWEEEEGDR